MSKFMKELYSLLDIKGNPSMAYHLQMDSQTERINHKVKKYLCMFTNNRQTDWVDWLPLIEFTYNNAVQEATSQTPFYMNKGRNPQAHPQDLVSVDNTPASKFLEAIQAAGCKAEECL
jgi:hypothetical protein